MPRGKLRPTLEEVKALLWQDRRPMVEAVLQELFETRDNGGAGRRKGERTGQRGLATEVVTTIANLGDAGR